MAKSLAARAASSAWARASASASTTHVGAEPQPDRVGDLVDGSDQRPGMVVAGVERGVRPANGVEQQRRCPRGVEVVVHRRTELVEHGGVGLGAVDAGDASGEGVEAGQRLDGRVDAVLGDLHRAAVVRLQQHHPVRTRVVVLDQVEQVRHVAEALRHLLALGVDDEPVVHPVVGERLAERDRLGALVLVVREPQVLATAVQVEALAEQVEAHHHALASASPDGPSPHGDGHAGRSRCRAWRTSTARSRPGGACWRRRRPRGRRHPSSMSSSRLVGEQAVVVDRLDRQVHAVVGDVRVVAARPARRSSRPSRRRSRWRAACRWAAGTSTASIACHHTASHLVVMSCHGRPSRSARSMILSSMSVMFDTRRTSRPVHSR